jgi:type IV secretory pathway VirB2 component (pilin)
MINLLFKKLFVILTLSVVMLFSMGLDNDAKAEAFCDWTAGSGTTAGSCKGATGATASEGLSCVALTTKIACELQGQAADANDNALVDTLCNVLSLATGNGGKAFAAFAIISLGIGFFTGKVSWGLMLGVAAGIAAMFGAPTIVAAISGEDVFVC